MEKQLCGYIHFYFPLCILEQYLFLFLFKGSDSLKPHNLRRNCCIGLKVPKLNCQIWRRKRKKAARSLSESSLETVSSLHPSLWFHIVSTCHSVSLIHQQITRTTRLTAEQFEAVRSDVSCVRVSLMIFLPPPAASLGGSTQPSSPQPGPINCATFCPLGPRGAWR